MLHALVIALVKAVQEKTFYYYNFCVYSTVYVTN